MQIEVNNKAVLKTAGKYVAEDITIIAKGGNLPQLFAPAISLSGNTLTITPNASNGGFSTDYSIYDGSTFVKTVTITTVDLSTVFAESTTVHTVTVQATADNFQNSAASNSVTYANIKTYTISTAVTGFTPSASNPTSINTGEQKTLNFTLQDGYEFPDDTPTITGASLVSWTSSGALTIKNPTANVTITITATKLPDKLATPQNVTADGTTVSWDEVEHATSYDVYVDGAVYETITDIYTDCITFTGESSDFTLSIGSYGAKEWDGTVWYSTDHNTWTVWDGTAISSVNKTLYLRGKNNTKFHTTNSARLTLSAKAGCSGNIMTLLDYENIPTSINADNCFRSLFYESVNLTSVPELPATTLAPYCYRSMFAGCTSLTTAPELPATTLANYCYNAMFRDCTNLVSAPELPAINLASYCYDGMFKNCANLTSAPELPAINLMPYCYQHMFWGCTRLASPPELPSTSLANYCYDGMFIDCTGLTSAPELPATNLVTFCYYQMFQDCTSLKINSSSGTKIFTCPLTLPINAVTQMFYNTGGSFKGTPEAGNTYYWYQ